MKSQEISRDIYSLKEDAEYDPYQMQEIERRLDTIFTMKRNMEIQYRNIRIQRAIKKRNWINRKCRWNK